MKRINSNSWKKPFDGDLRPSQDSAYNSSQDRIHNPNSQFMDFSQVSTQDLFGQSSQSQKEQGSQKLSMYEKWLSRRSTKPNQNWTPKETEGPGRVANKPTLSSHLGNRLRSDEKDERDALEMLFNRFCDSEQQMKSVIYNLQELLEKMGGVFINDDAKAILSSFIEDIAKSHDNLASHFQNSEKYKHREKDLENQLASKNYHVASLESKLKLLEDQVKKKESDESMQNRGLREEMNSSNQSAMKKLEDIREIIGHQKEAFEQFRLNLDELRENCATSKGVQTVTRELESRILKEMKRLPKDVKNAMEIKSEVLQIFEGMPIEIEHSLKTKLQSFTKDIKDEFSKEHKRYNEQVLKKQLDRILTKVDNVVSEHKKMQMSVKTTIQESVSHQLKDIDQCVKGFQDKSSSDSVDLRQVHQRITNCQGEQSRQLQSMIAQQKELCEHIKNLLKNDIESIQYTKGIFNNYNHNEKSGALVESNIPIQHKDRINDRHCDGEESNFCNKSLRSDVISPNNRIHKSVDTNVNNTWMPVINQTNIYPSSRRHDAVFKSPLLRLVNNNNRHHLMATDKSESDNLQVNFDYFKRPTQLYCKGTPSPVAAIKPLTRPTHTPNTMTLNDKTANDKTQVSYNARTNDKDRQKKPFEPNNMNGNDSQENGYWLRNRNGHFYNENGCIRQTPRRLNDKQQLPDNLLLGHDSQRSSNHRLSRLKEHAGAVYNDVSNGSIRRTPHLRLGDHTGNRAGGRKRHCHELNQEENSKITTRDISVYDFNDDDGGPRQSLPQMHKDKGVISPVSSPALTINLNWAETPSMKRRRHGMGKSGILDVHTRNVEDYASSILDL